MLMLRVWCCIFVLYHPTMFFFIFVNNQFPNQFSLPGSGGRWSSGNRRASAQSSCQRMASWDRRTMRPSGYRWGWRTAHRGCLKWCLDLLSLCSNPELAQLVRNLKVSRNRLKTFEDSWADTVDEIVIINRVSLHSDPSTLNIPKVDDLVLQRLPCFLALAPLAPLAALACHLVIRQEFEPHLLEMPEALRNFSQLFPVPWQKVTCAAATGW